jgi:hypothetical protein
MTIMLYSRENANPRYIAVVSIHHAGQKKNLAAFPLVNKVGECSANLIGRRICHPKVHTIATSSRLEFRFDRLAVRKQGVYTLCCSVVDMRTSATNHLQTSEFQVHSPQSYRKPQLTGAGGAEGITGPTLVRNNIIVSTADRSEAEVRL